MKKLLWAIAATISLSATAQASIVPTLENVTNNGDGTFTFNYQGTLGADAGVTKGSRLVIFDFAGYVADSIFAPGSNIAVSTEAVTTGMLKPSGVVDDPTLTNLVFTWVGPDFQTSGGPTASIDFNGLGALSTLGGVAASFFSGTTIKNNPPGPGGAGTLIETVGRVGVPAAVPEPATWGMMISGFGIAGAAIRRRSATVVRRELV